jgi:hypothetical protein
MITERKRFFGEGTDDGEAFIFGKDTIIDP